MSLDVYLRMPGGRAANPSDRIFIRRDGATVEVTREEWDEMYPDRAPVVSVAYEDDDWPNYVFEGNITHNLGRMARQVSLSEGTFESLYEALWRPDEQGVKVARDLIAPLRDGLGFLQADRDHYEQWNPENGWGNYDQLVRFTTGYLSACEEWPDAEIEVSR